MGDMRVMGGRFMGFRGRRSATLATLFSDTAANFAHDIIVERTRVGLLVGYAEHGQEVENHVGLDLELASQLVDADFTHTMTPPARILRAGDLNAADLAFIRTFRALHPTRFVLLVRFRIALCFFGRRCCRRFFVKLNRRSRFRLNGCSR
jgi:hypothetical protein